MNRTVISFNVEGLQKHMHTIAEMLDDFKPSLLMMQETKAHKIEELSI